MAPLIALPQSGRMNVGVRLLGGQNKNVDDVLAARINQRGDILPAENIEAPADQRKTFVREIFHGGNKSELAIEPRLDSVLVGGSNVHEMAGLQGANMRVDDLGRGEGRRRGAVLEARHSKPGNGGNNQWLRQPQAIAKRECEG